MIQRRLFVSSVLVLALVAAGSCGGPPPSVPGRDPLVLPETILVRSQGRIVRVPLEEYLIGTTLAEVGPVGERPEVVERIFRVQAIIARTYAASHLGRHAAEGFNLCDTTHCQVYDPARLRTSRFAAAARAAVDATRGQILVFNGRPGQALFHADCGGHTADAAAVWGGQSVPYLTGAPDPLPEGTHRTWQFELTADQLREALNASPTTAIGATLHRVRVAARDASGRVALVEVDGSEPRSLRGEQLRAAINQVFGARAIMSTRFTLQLTAEGGYRFEGTGYGHGVGLCQVGAAARLRRGDDVARVLAAYYPGTTLTRAASQVTSRPRPFPGR